eukprot:6208020-Pleurochrysis_carterae.AAC.2
MQAESQNYGMDRSNLSGAAMLHLVLGQPPHLNNPSCLVLLLNGVLITCDILAARKHKIRSLQVSKVAFNLIDYAFTKQCKLYVRLHAGMGCGSACWDGDNGTIVAAIERRRPWSALVIVRVQGESELSLQQPA